MKSILKTVAIATYALLISTVLALAQGVTPVANPASLMPVHGTVSVQIPTDWENDMVAGNGIMGCLLAGDPQHDTLISDHCKLWLPLGSKEILPHMAPYLAQTRTIDASSDEGDGQDYYLKQATANGWGGLIWTDPYHPGFFLSIDQPANGPIIGYARVENFSTGDVWAQWHTGDGDFKRSMFVSKSQNVIVSRTIGPPGKVTLTVTMQKVQDNRIASTILHQVGMITCHNIYVNGKGGYDGAVRVVAKGGTETSDGQSITIQNADSVTLIMRIQPWKTPLPSTQSEALEYSPTNPDFTNPSQIAGPYRAAAAYNPQWLTDLTSQLNALPGDYDTLLASHIAAWSPVYNRVSIDLGGSPDERGMSSEDLLSLAQKNQKLSSALLERMYDAGRYVFLCSAGPYTPPNLFGIWTGTWQPAWSGDYTTDTNLGLDVESAYSANMAENMSGFFRLWDSYIPDFQTNAMNLYGCRGILTGPRHSNVGLDLHWGDWPGNMWTCGAGWMAHFYYEYYEYTGDKTFLRKEAIPFMEQTALFYEDFLNGTEDANGHYMFRPSYSAENGWGDDSSQDIEISHEMLTNLIAGCQTLGIDQDKVIEWKALLAKMPPLLINNQGQLKEWSNPTATERNNHRHLMHLYGAWEAQEFSPEDDPKLFAAARVALMNRINASTENATHGYMQTAMCAANLGWGDLSFSRLELMAKGRSIYNNFVDGHFPGPGTFCDDGNGATPEIVDRWIVQSKMGRLALLPAIPAAISHGTLKGSRARGDILINSISWDTAAGKLTAVVTSGYAQKIALVMPPGATVSYLTIDGKPQTIVPEGVEKFGCQLDLPKDKPVAISAAYTMPANAP